VKAFVSSQVRRVDLFDLATSGLRIPVVVEEGAVIEVDSIKRQDGPQFYIVARLRTMAGPLSNADTLPPAVRAEDLFREVWGIQVGDPTLEGEQLLDEVGNRDDRGPHVEGVAVDLPHGRTTARPIHGLHDGGVEAHALQADTHRESAKAGPNDDGRLRRFCGCVHR
jgi:hypothetical protein